MVRRYLIKEELVKATVRPVAPVLAGQAAGSEGGEAKERKETQLLLLFNDVFVHLRKDKDAQTVVPLMLVWLTAPSAPAPSPLANSSSAVPLPAHVHSHSHSHSHSGPTPVSATASQTSKKEEALTVIMPHAVLEFPDPGGAWRTALEDALKAYLPIEAQRLKLRTRSLASVSHVDL